MKLYKVGKIWRRGVDLFDETRTENELNLIQSFLPCTLSVSPFHFYGLSACSVTCVEYSENVILFSNSITLTATRIKSLVMAVQRDTFWTLENNCEFILNVDCTTLLLRIVLTPISQEIT
jgi:hypothetical protein